MIKCNRFGFIISRKRARLNIVFIDFAKEDRNVIFSFLSDIHAKKDLHHGDEKK